MKTNKHMKTNKLKRRIICSLILFSIILSIVLIFSKPNKNSPDTSISPIISKEEEISTNKTYSLSLVAVGDALIHGTVYKDAYANGKYDFTKMIEYVKPIVSNYDLAFYNQETILGGTELGLSTYPTFNSPQEVGDAMLDAGFNLVSLATNHTMDRGEKAIINSRAYWDSKKDVTAVGSYTSMEDRNTPVILEKNNITYTLLSYTYGTNGIPVPKGKEYLVNLYSDSLAKSDIEKIRDKVDVIIVSMHWGTEYTHVPTDEQVRQANYLSSLGVDIIIGHHPHVIEPITKINNTLVIYSLGNFISSQKGLPRLIGLMSMINITKNIDNGATTINIENTNNELLYTYYSNSKNFKVIPFSKINSNYLPNYKSIYDDYCKILRKYDQNVPVISVAD